MVYFTIMDVFTALAEPTRRNIIEMLALRGQLTATQISDRFRISPPAISQHLKILREAHVLDMKKHAQKRIYSLNPQKILEIEAWSRKMNSLWSNRFDNMDKILAQGK